MSEDGFNSKKACNIAQKDQVKIDLLFLSTIFWLLLCSPSLPFNLNLFRTLISEARVFQGFLLGVFFSFLLAKIIQNRSFIDFNIITNIKFNNYNMLCITPKLVFLPDNHVFLHILHSPLPTNTRNTTTTTTTNPTTPHLKSRRAINTLLSAVLQQILPAFDFFVWSSHLQKLSLPG